MNSRQRVTAAIEHGALDRIPKYDAFWDETVTLFKQSGMKLKEPEILTVEGRKVKIGNPVADFFGFDIDMLFMDVSMRFPARLVEDDGSVIVIEDRCGYTAKKFKNKTSSLEFIDHKIKTEKDWEENKSRLEFDPGDKSRVDNMPYFLRLNEYPSWQGAKKIFDAYRKRNKYISIYGYGPLEAAWRFHGYEDALMDLVLRPEMMAEMTSKAADLIIDTVKYMVENDMKPDGLWLAEDMGGTHALLFSPDVYKQILFPCHKRIGDYLHSVNIHFIMHSCGKIEPLLPDLIVAGLDVIQALQANTGMDVRELKKKYGKQLALFGNISEQTFKNGKKTVEEELRKKIPAAKEGGGYIYHSDHSIPPEVSYDTYLHAMKILDEIGVYDGKQK